MAFFLITMSHPDDELWAAHVDAHLGYLYDLRDAGILRASGRIVDAEVKTGCILLTAADHAAAERIVADDPFSRAHAIGELTFAEWDPFIGIFADEASGIVPGAASGDSLSAEEPWTS